MKKGLSNLVELVVAFVLALGVIMFCFSKDENFENLALGEFTKPFFAQKDGNYIQTIGIRFAPSVLQGVEHRNLPHHVLILGNSQTHSINQLKPGNTTFVGVLADSLQKDNIDIISSSVPNANLEELYMLYKYWSSSMHIDALVIPVFLDDMREEGLQPAFFKDLSHFNIRDTSACARMINSQLCAMNNAASADLSGIHKTYQEIVETRLNQVLDQNFPPWHFRPNIRGEAFNFLYKLRNTAFGINAQSKRKIIKNSYERNLAALKTMLADCRREHIRVLLYIPPIRNDYEIPYVQSEYASFKQQMEDLCRENNADFFNFENVVPGKYWGYKGTRTLTGKSDIDFMHFQFPGHIMLAKKLQPEIISITK